MRMSQMIGKRFKEQPAEAVLASHALLLRGGYARQIANGIYSLLMPGKRIVQKIERILREEMDAIGGQEVLMPLVLPRELWEASGRWSSVGSELVRFKDRTSHDMLLAMTHEEAVVHLLRGEVESYKQLPCMVYQIQTKFRDEPRSRGGLIRVREFTMKDGYSFHTTPDDLQKFYQRCSIAYQRIFARVGIPETVVVASDTGMMGGNRADEFMLLCEAGEDTIVKCPACGYLANMEVAAARVKGFAEPALPLEKVHTPEKKTIDEVATFLKIPHEKTVKAVFYESDADGKLVLALIRGDLEINEVKLTKIIKTPPVLAGTEKILAAGAVPGFASPLNINRQLCQVVVDRTVAENTNLCCGANEADWHYLNFNLTRDLPDSPLYDIAQVRAGDGCPQCSAALETRRGIEVGNIFQLGQHYSKTMGMRYLDAAGAEQIPFMGCYGIGVGRLLSSVMEVRNDKFGPIWPISIAPWQIHLNALQTDQPGVSDAAEKIYSELTQAGLEVLYDDRNERPGGQFADADLLGVPIRLIVSPRNLAKGGVEAVRRGERNAELIPLAQVIAHARAMIAQLMVF